MLLPAACAPQARQEAILATKKLSEARAAVKEEAEGRIRAERAHEEDARQWDSAAQSLRGTIQELHDKYAPPRDLDRLRAELQQELEAPHAERVASLEAELEATRELLSASRRRFEALKVRGPGAAEPPAAARRARCRAESAADCPLPRAQRSRPARSGFVPHNPPVRPPAPAPCRPPSPPQAEFEAASASHANEAEARADAHRRETAELSAQVLALQEELDAAAADTSAREAKSRAAAAEARLEAAEAELEAARGAAAEAEGARERSAAEAAASKAEAEVAVADARRAAAAAERSRAAMTDECARLREEGARLNARARDAEAGAASARGSVQLLEDRARRADAAAEGRTSAVRAELARERDAFRLRAEEARRAQAEAEERARRAEAAAAESAREVVSVAQRTRRELEGRLARVGAERDAAGEEAAQAIVARGEREAVLERRAEAAEAAAARAKEDLAAARRACDAAESASQEAVEGAGRAEAARAGLAAALEELRSEYAALQARHERVAEAERSHAAERARLQGEAAEARAEAESARAESSRAAAEAAALREKASRVHGDAVEKSNELLAAERAAFESELGRQKRRGAEYKRKLMTLVDKHGQFRAVAKARIRQEEASAAALEAEVTALRRRLREAEMEQAALGRLARVPVGGRGGRSVVGGMEGEGWGRPEAHFASTVPAGRAVGGGGWPAPGLLSATVGRQPGTAPLRVPLTVRAGRGGASEAGARDEALAADAPAPFKPVHRGQAAPQDLRGGRLGADARGVAAHGVVMPPFPGTPAADGASASPASSHPEHDAGISPRDARRV